MLLGGDLAVGLLMLMVRSILDDMGFKTCRFGGDALNQELGGQTRFKLYKSYNL